LATGAGATLGEDPSLTIECWFRIGQTGVEQALLTKRAVLTGGAPDLGLSLWVGADNHLKASWGFGNRSVVLSAGTVTLATGQAYHAAMVWDGDVETARLYINGSEVASQQVADAILSLDDQPLVLANSSAAPWMPLQGVIDEIRITAKDDPFTASVVGTASYSDWAWNHLGLSSIRAGDAHKGADADGDGESNIKESVFGGDGMDPARGAAAPLIALSGAGAARQAVFSYRRLAQGAMFRIEASDNLDNWSDVTATAVQDGPPLVHGDGTETVRYRIGAPAATSLRRFFRAVGDWEDSYIPPSSP
jgi:hypothetical protein